MRSTGRSWTQGAARLAASLLSTRPLPCQMALTMAALLTAASAAQATQTNTTVIDQESAKVEFRHGGSAHALDSEGTEMALRPVAGMHMSPQLADNLALLFDKFGRSEFILCLEGGTDDSGELELRDFRMPHMAYSRSTSAAVQPDGGCEQYDGVIGTLHNHPPTYPEDSGRESNNCYLSRMDIMSWLKHSTYEYTTVMCGPRTWAWWHRSQVNEEKVLAFPREGQLHEPVKVTVH